MKNTSNIIKAIGMILLIAILIGAIAVLFTPKDGEELPEESTSDTNVDTGTDDLPGTDTDTVPDTPLDNYTDGRIAYNAKYGFLDGKNTFGEYNEVIATPLNAYGNDTNGDQMRVIYTDDAVYVLVEIYDGSIANYSDCGSAIADAGFLGFKLGSSFSGVKRFYRGTWREVMSNGIVNMREGYDLYENESEYFAIVNNNGNGFAMEARFPVDKMSYADQIAFKNGTLDVRFTAGTQDGAYDNYGQGYILNTYDGDVMNRGWDGNATTNYFSYVSSNGSKVYYLRNTSSYPKYSFSPKLYSSDITYLGTSELVLDGGNTSNEYLDTLEFPMVYTTDSWWGKSPDLNDKAYLAYTDTGIYVLVKGDPGSSSSWDMTAVGFKIGSSYVGSNVAQANNSTSFLYSFGESTVDASFFALNNNNLDLEIFFPVANMTEEDQEAFANGTLEVAFNFMNMDSYCATASFKMSSYDVFTVEEKVQNEVLTNLKTFTLAPRFVEVEAVEVSE